MGDVSEKNVKDAAQYMKSINDTVLRMLKILAEMLELNDRNSSQREMARWIRSGGGIYEYSIEGKDRGAVLAELDKKQIPYIETNDKSSILIRDCDKELVENLHRQVLIANGNYYQVVDAKEMESAVAQFDKIKNKELFTLDGLSNYEMEVLKNKCNHISAGFMIGVAEENGRYSATIMGKHVLNPDPERQDFCKSFLESRLSLNGQNASLKVDQIDADAKVDARVASLKGDDTNHYIVGARDRNQYIELSSTGFEYYRVKNGEDGRVQTSVRCDINNPNYEAELQRYMDRIYDRVVIEDINKLNKHLDGEDVLSSQRPHKSQEAYDVSLAEHQTADIIDRMIKESIAHKHLQFDKSEDALSYYTQEAGKILAASLRGEMLQEYPDDKMAELNSLYSEKGIDRDVYMRIADKLSVYEGHSHDAINQTKEKEKEGKEEERE